MTTDAPSRSFLDLAASPRRDLVSHMHRGQRPSPARLAGFEYRGLNTAGWLRVAGADRFVKGFAADRGYNRRIPRGPSTGPWLPASGPDPEPFAFFRVGPVDPESAENRYLKALLLDYGPFAHNRLDPAGPLRDYLVTVSSDDDLLLGHAFIAVGRWRVAATFFVLERLRPVPQERSPE